MELCWIIKNTILIQNSGPTKTQLCSFFTSWFFSFHIWKPKSCPHHCVLMRVMGDTLSAWHRVSQCWRNRTDRCVERGLAGSALIGNLFSLSLQKLMFPSIVEQLWLDLIPVRSLWFGWRDESKIHSMNTCHMWTTKTKAHHRTLRLPLTEIC